MEREKRGWARVLLFILPYIFIAGGIQILGAYVCGIEYPSNEHTYIEQFLLKFFEFLGTLLALWIFMKYVDKRPFVALGFSFKNRRKELLAGFLLGTLIMAFAFSFLTVLDEIIFKSIDFNRRDALVSILLFAVVAVAEEVVLRGYVLRNLMLSFNKYIALIVSSVLFAAMHGLNPNLDDMAFINLFLAGVLLGISYVYTRNLWFPIGLHFSWNLFQSYFGFNVSGQDFYSIVKFDIQDANLLNGGAFGFEGSILAVCIQIFAIVFIYKYYKCRKAINDI
ncbi:CPBP family intramembrane glutamic endopeptidase [Leeuwenhoekiella sp. MAR_2009_132]|uniref:CPBP family intramembrane glutamic endopeptidase n=1 Tax=Leeuwenhoekiella sp. MAR_2009_132 TaxID=1392489 RepID=UPI00055FAF9F|nr:CPBP family intramembrane glutamic endopeptidase [Leeuwenhoekiella sp. MAR_2009_132]